MPTRVVIAPVTASALTISLPEQTVAAPAAPATTPPAAPVQGQISAGAPGLGAVEQPSTAEPPTAPTIATSPAITPPTAAIQEAAVRHGTNQGLPHKGTLALLLVGALIVAWTAASASAARPMPPITEVPPS
jgi:hypothetical protein